MVLEPHELDLILDNIAEHYRPFIVAMVGTGMRLHSRVVPRADLWKVAAGSHPVTPATGLTRNTPPAPMPAEARSLRAGVGALSAASARLWRRTRLAAGAVEVAKDTDLTAVVHRLARDVEHQGSERFLGEPAAEGPDGRQQLLVAQVELVQKQTGHRSHARNLEARSDTALHYDGRAAHTMCGVTGGTTGRKQDDRLETTPQR